VKLWKGAVKDKAGLVLFLIVFVLSLFFDISPVVFVLFCALAGVVLTRTGVRGK
jgi:chromate transport protein ChrA